MPYLPADLVAIKNYEMEIWMRAYAGHGGHRHKLEGREDSSAEVMELHLTLEADYAVKAWRKRFAPGRVNAPIGPTWTET